MKIKVKFLHENAKLPLRCSKGSAGFDLYAAANSTVPPSYVDKDGELNIGRAVIHTGIAVQLPGGTVGKVASRSGLSTKYNIEVGAGWIDSDYRGELMVELKNFSSEPLNIKVGQRVAQLIIINITDATFIQTTELEKTDRGEKGFGSSGK